MKQEKPTKRWKEERDNTMMENNILNSKLVDNGLLYTPIVVPEYKDFCIRIVSRSSQSTQTNKATMDSEEHTDL